MRLDELDWQVHGTTGSYRIARVTPTLRVYQALKGNAYTSVGNYDFHIGERASAEAMRSRYHDVEPIAAQAILYHLLDTSKGNS